jgi:hypothetical protein
VEDRLLILERLKPDQMWELWTWYADPDRGNHGKDLTFENLYVDALIVEGYTGSAEESGPLTAFLLGLSGAATLHDAHGKTSPFPVELALKDVFDGMKEFHFTSDSADCGYPNCGQILEHPGIEEAISGWRTLMLILAASYHLPAPDNFLLMQPQRMRFPFFIGVQACGVDVISYRSEIGDSVQDNPGEDQI